MSRFKTQYQHRHSVLFVLVISLFIMLIARLISLQVLDTPSSAAQIESESVVTIYTPAPRGRILDRDGRTLVGNRQVPVIEANREQATPAAIRLLASVLSETVSTLTQAIDNDQYEGVEYVPVKEPATAVEMLYIDEHSGEFPGIRATVTTEPYVTKLGAYAGDVIGYVGQADEEELTALQKQNPSKHYAAGDIVGQTGIEAAYQNQLAGTPGMERILVNASGKEIQILKDTPPVPGDNLRLTLNGELQLVADESILQGQAVARSEPSDTGNGNYRSPGGSAVVEDPDNGQILALATEPTFNPEEFDKGITEAQYQALVRDPDDPLENRAIQGQYAPGSTFKLVTGTAGLHYGLITPTSIFNDTKGYIDVAGHIFHDDDGIGAGYIDLPEALTVSSDNYFNVIGEELWDQRSRYGDLALQSVAASYGLGKPTGIDLPGEERGLIPTPEQQVELHKEEPDNPDAPGYWVVGDSIEMAIGQFQDEVTPLQLDNAYATFTNGGTRYRPQLVLDIESPDNRILKTFPSHVEGHSTSLTASQRQGMIDGYLGVTHDSDGTGYPVFGNGSLANYDIAGKTGTAQVSGVGNQDTSVFMGFAPATQTHYVADCFMEDSGYGESIAAPIVRRIYDAIYHQPLQPVAFQAVTGSGD